MIKAGTKVKEVISIINTHFSIYLRNEVFVFTPRSKSIRQTGVRAGPSDEGREQSTAASD